MKFVSYLFASLKSFNIAREECVDFTGKFRSKKFNMEDKSLVMNSPKILKFRCEKPEQQKSRKFMHAQHDGKMIIIGNIIENYLH